MAEALKSVRQAGHTSAFRIREVGIVLIYGTSGQVSPGNDEAAFDDLESAGRWLRALDRPVMTELRALQGLSPHRLGHLKLRLRLPPKIDAEAHCG